MNTESENIANQFVKIEHEGNLSILHETENTTYLVAREANRESLSYSLEFDPTTMEKLFLEQGLQLPRR